MYIFLFRSEWLLVCIIVFTVFILSTFIGTRNVSVTKTRISKFPIYCFKLYSEIDWIYIINVYIHETSKNSLKFVGESWTKSHQKIQLYGGFLLTTSNLTVQSRNNQNNKYINKPLLILIKVLKHKDVRVWNAIERIKMV